MWTTSSVIISDKVTCNLIVLASSTDVHLNPLNVIFFYVEKIRETNVFAHA